MSNERTFDEQTMVEAYSDYMGEPCEHGDVEERFLVFAEYEHMLEDVVIEALGDMVDFGGASEEVERYFSWDSWASDVILESVVCVTHRGVYMFLQG